MLARPLLLCAALLSGCAHGKAVSTAAGDAQVQATLVAAERAVVPGRPLELAVRFVIAPGWHIYWSDPGDSGLPTRVTFQATPDLPIGPVRYPPPRHFTSPGDIKGNGYEHETMLSATLQAPPRLSAPRVMLQASARWLACRESCIPGRADLLLTLPTRRR